MAPHRAANRLSARGRVMICAEIASGRLMPKSAQITHTTAAPNAGGFLISTGRAADMTPTRPATMTDDDTTTTRQDNTAGNRVRQALAEARRARHHNDCHCRIYRGIACNATDALFQRAINRELDYMNEENPK